MPRIIKSQLPLLVAIIMLAAPRMTFACSVCMGRSDDAATQGLNAAVLTLLATLLLVLGTFAGFLVHLIRRSINRPLALPSMPRGAVQ